MLILLVYVLLAEKMKNDTKTSKKALNTKEKALIGKIKKVGAKHEFLIERVGVFLSEQM